MDTGEVFVVDSQKRVTSAFDAAWAKDANGRPVPTRYRIEGSTLVQVVDFTPGTAFPVVADPGWWKVVGCAAAITWLIGSNLLAVAKLIKIKKYIQALGGVKAPARLVVGATTWEERMRVGGSALVGLAAELVGVAGVKSACFQGG